MRKDYRLRNVNILDTYTSLEDLKAIIQKAENSELFGYIVEIRHSNNWELIATDMKENKHYKINGDTQEFEETYILPCEMETDFDTWTKEEFQSMELREFNEYNETDRNYIMKNV